MSHSPWLCAIGVAALVTAVGGFPYGPPVELYPQICDDMFPFGHNVTAKTNAAPFEVVVNSNCYKEGLDLQVYVRLRENEDTFFEGLFVQARTAAPANMSHGTFDTGSDRQLKPLSCFGQQANAASQAEAHHYTCKTFSWTAGTNFQESFKFRATVVHETDEFWLDILSGTLNYDANCEVTTTESMCPEGGPTGAAQCMRAWRLPVLAAIFFTWAAIIALRR